MCTAASQEMIPDFLKNLDGTSVSVPGDPDYIGPGGGVHVPKNPGPRPINRAEEVPLGDGLADAAKTSILSRRERIRRAVEGDGDPNGRR